MSVAISSNGITQKMARARRQSRMKRKTMDPTNISELVTSEVTPSVTSWSSASMSLVRRLTIQPVFWRLKKSRLSFCRWAKSWRRRS